MYNIVKIPKAWSIGFTCLAYNGKRNTADAEI